MSRVMLFGICLIAFIGVKPMPLQAAIVEPGAFTSICNVNPRDGQYSDAVLYRASKPLSQATDGVYIALFNKFFSQTSSGLKGRVQLLKNNIQSGVSLFYRRGPNGDELFITFNPVKIGSSAGTRMYHNQSVIYLVLHALSHIAQNDFLVKPGTVYAHWNTELNADKYAAGQMLGLFPGLIAHDFFEVIMPRVIYAQRPGIFYPPVSARVLSAVSGYLEAIVPGTFEMVMVKVLSGVRPSERAKELKKAQVDPSFKELHESGMMVGMTTEYSATEAMAWLKLFKPADSTYIYYSKHVVLKHKSKKQSEDEDDDEDYEEDESDGNASFEATLAKAPFWYRNTGSRRHRSIFVRSTRFAAPVELEIRRDDSGYGQIQFTERRTNGKCFIVGEHGEYFEGNIPDPSKDIFQGTLTSSSGSNSIGKFNKLMNPLK
jgi:hypothetical protein